MRSSITPKDLAEHAVLVAGDAIVDRYLEGTAARISREAPVPIVTALSTYHRCGGAANTAANVAAVGGEPMLAAIMGKDQEGIILSSLCDDAGIKASFVESDLPTPVKTRIMASGQQLLRVDECRSAAQCAKQLADAVCSRLHEAKALVLSDYGLGALDNATQMISAARERKVPVAVDPRRDDWACYRGASVVTPNRDEFLEAGPNSPADEAGKAQALMSQLDIGAILVTAGPAGMTLHTPDSDPVEIPTRARKVYDVTGAGDTVVAVMALGIAAGAQMSEAARWANAAAGVVVGKMGAATVTAEELETEPGGHGGRIVSADEVAGALVKAREGGDKVVLTNGCFDIIHAGHIQCLATAAGLGDLLVVGVNDDESVRALKGGHRPVVPLSERMQVLAGLGCVDLVVPFSGPDATELVRSVRPDTYVKGGDWQDDEPPEATEAKKLGASVVYPSYVPHVSTSEIIDRIQKAGG